jgi:hypothetical protein
MIRIPESQIHFYTRLKLGEHRKATHFALIPSKDKPIGWEDVIYLREPIVDSSGGVRASEYVYILVNRSIPNMVKIGMTTGTVDKRAKDISDATGVPTPWIPVWWFRCFASSILEKRVHKHLTQYRVADNREMFNIDSVTAQQVIEDLGKDFTNVRLAEMIERNYHLESPVDTVPTSNRS